MTSGLVMTAAARMVVWHFGQSSTLIPRVLRISSAKGTYDVDVRERGPGVWTGGAGCWSACARSGSTSAGAAALILGCAPAETAGLASTGGFDGGWVWSHGLEHGARAGTICARQLDLGASTPS